MRIVLLLVMFFLASLSVFAQDSSKESVKPPEIRGYTVTVPTTPSIVKAPYHFMTSDGERIAYVEARPVEEKPYPALIVLGGSEPTSPWLNSNFFELCKSGICVFTLGERGVEPDPKKWTPNAFTTDPNVYPSTLDQMSKDLTEFVDKVVLQNPNVDGGHICIFGHSQGAYLAQRALANSPEKFQAVFVSGSPVEKDEVTRTYQRKLAIHAWFVNHDRNGDGNVDAWEYSGMPSAERLMESVTGIKPRTEMEKIPEKLDPTKYESLEFYESKITEVATKLMVGGAVTEDQIFDAIANEKPKVEYAKRIEELRQAEVNAIPAKDLALKSSKPIYFYQGEKDGFVPASAIHVLEEKAQELGKKNLHFHFYKDLGHMVFLPFPVVVEWDPEKGTYKKEAVPYGLPDITKDILAEMGIEASKPQPEQVSTGTSTPQSQP